MGLDITAYKGIEKVDISFDEFDSNWDGSMDFIHNYRDFPDHLEGLDVECAYRFSESMGFRAGSYFGYNFWRNELSKAILGVDARTVWNNPEQYKDRPFYWLINFTDCDGVIGPVLCKKLARDFLDYQDNVKYNDSLMPKYKEWQEAFEFAASGDGYISFH